MKKKPIILIFTGYYSPGYKAGGILRYVINLVNNLFEEFDFLIITRDRDLGNDTPYDGIILNNWIKVDNALVMYLPPKAISCQNLNKIINQTPHDIILLCSYFELFTIKVLINRIFNYKKFNPVIVAPFGEFSWASLSQKYFKKIFFIKISSFFGLYRNVKWRVSSQYETNDLIKVIKINKDNIYITGDPPIIDDYFDNQLFDNNFSSYECIKIIFLSRISREKNLDFALRIFSQIKRQVFFDIYGPIENVLYWNECKKLISQLSSNVTVRYCGSLIPCKVFQVLTQYDVLFLPTGGESYGNVIAESLRVGTPVLISTNTPWRNLRDDGIGWDLDLSDESGFIDIIENYPLLDHNLNILRRLAVKKSAEIRLFDPKIIDSNRQLFLKTINFD